MNKNENIEERLKKLCINTLEDNSKTNFNQVIEIHISIFTALLLRKFICCEKQLKKIHTVLLAFIHT